MPPQASTRKYSQNIQRVSIALHSVLTGQNLLVPEVLIITFICGMAAQVHTCERSLDTLLQFRASRSVRTDRCLQVGVMTKRSACGIVLPPNTHKHLLGTRIASESVCFSPDSQTLASGSWDDTLRLWDVSTGQALKTHTGHTPSVNSVSFSPDGQTVASGGWDHTIRLWNVDTGEHKQTLIGHTAPVESVCFSPDGTTLASGSSDETIRLWNVNTGQSLKRLERMPTLS